MKAGDQREDQHLFETLLAKLIKDVMNDQCMDDLVDKLNKQPVQLYDTFDSSEPANLTKILKKEENKEQIQRRKGPDFSDYRNLFMEEEFISLTDLILENTFFNVIREATHKEMDLTKLSKTYLKKI
jgi:hypothetical protein